MRHVWAADAQACQAVFLTCLPCMAKQLCFVCSADTRPSLASMACLLQGSTAESSTGDAGHHRCVHGLGSSRHPAPHPQSYAHRRDTAPAGRHPDEPGGHAHGESACVPDKHMTCHLPVRGQLSWHTCCWHCQLDLALCRGHAPALQRNDEHPRSQLCCSCRTVLTARSSTPASQLGEPAAFVWTSPRRP